MTIGRQREARLATEREIGFIYVAAFLDRPVVKIGFSLAPAKRMKTLFRKKAEPGRLLVTVPGRITDERALHRALAKHCIRPRVGRERPLWFALSIPAGIAIGAFIKWGMK